MCAVCHCILTPNKKNIENDNNTGVSKCVVKYLIWLGIEKCAHVSSSKIKLDSNEQFNWESLLSF